MCRRRSAVKSQAFAFVPRWKVANERWALRKVSCTRSSASGPLRVSASANAWHSGRSGRQTRSNSVGSRPAMGAAAYTFHAIAGATDTMLQVLTRISVDGDIQPPERAAVRVLDHGFLFGD